MFDSHPPLAERIAILRKLEGLDPDGRGPVDETITGVPVDLQAISQSADIRTAQPLTGGLAVNTPAAAATTATADEAPMVIPKPGQSPPGWFRRDATTLRYWNGNVFTDWTRDLATAAAGCSRRTRSSAAAAAPQRALRHIVVTAGSPSGTEISPIGSKPRRM